VTNLAKNYTKIFQNEKCIPKPYIYF